MPRPRIRLALAAVTALVVADTLAWVWLTGRLEAGAAAWVAARRAEGWPIAAGPAERGGWPFNAEVSYPGVSVARGFTWQVPLVRLRLNPLHPGELTVAFEGEQQVAAPGLPPVTLNADRLTLQVPLDDPAAAATLRAVSLRAQAAGQTVSAGGATLHLLAGALDATVSDAVLPPGTPFGPAVAAATMTAKLEGPEVASGNPAQAAAAWRDGGGRVVVPRAAIVWGALDAQGQFTLTLDPALQPRGEGSVHIANYPAAIAALAQSGAIGAGDAKVASTLLGLLSGGTPAVTVPLALEGGVLSAGHYPLARIPPVNWGG